MIDKYDLWLKHEEHSNQVSFNHRAFWGLADGLVVAGVCFGLGVWLI